MINRLLFSLWYFGRPPWDSGISPPELIEYIHTHSPGRAIDLGCGTGTNVLTLAEAGWKVTGVDFAWRAIFLARRKIRKAGYQAHLTVGDVTRIKTADPFDLALDIGCFHGVTDRQAYLERLVQCLKPAGDWLMYGFFKTEIVGAGPGLTELDLNLIERSFNLVWRKDGRDKKERPSTWFLYQPLLSAG